MRALFYPTPTESMALPSNHLPTILQVFMVFVGCVMNPIGIWKMNQRTKKTIFNYLTMVLFASEFGYCLCGGAGFLIRGFCVRDHPFMTSANFSRFLTPTPLSSAIFLLLSFGKFGKFLTPPLLKDDNVLNGWSLSFISNQNLELLNNSDQKNRQECPSK